jgi:murein L,D-transpeptidase YafK
VQRKIRVPSFVCPAVRIYRKNVLIGMRTFLAAGALMLMGPCASKEAVACTFPEIRVYKKEGELELWCGGAPVRTMGATFGASPIGAKEREGDEKTPEGVYTVTAKTKSERFHRFLAVSYPNDEDRRHAKAKGITRLGGGIGIHGVRANLAGPARAWTGFARWSGLAGVWGPTDGCIGLANEDVEVLYDAVPVGTRIVIAASR